MKPITYGSVCSGIEAATVAWHPLGWKPAFFSEIENFPRQTLQHHYPTTPLHGDFTTIASGQYEPIDLLVGGTPCQAFSIAGLRKGLDDPRGNLTLGFLGLADRLRPRWLVWENVPGVLSIDGGKTFGTFLGGLAELGYGFAYRVLDAQYFGVAQRRRRVFVVGYAGDWRRAAAVLFERASLSGHSAPSREKGKGVTACARPSSALGGGSNTITARMVAFGEYSDDGTASAMKARDYKDATDLVASVCSGHGYWMDAEGKAATLRSQDSITKADTLISQPTCITGDTTHTLKAEGFDAFEDGTGRGQPIINHRMAVRRLTPVECERLQGFPDNYTDIRPKGKSTPDGPRYKALGNSMAVPVMAWIGKRIQAVEQITNP